MLATETAYGTGRLRCGFGRRAIGRAPILALLGVVACLLGARPARAITVTLPSAGDSWIDQGAQTTNKGADSHMHVLSTVKKLRRGVIQFDLSSIPACASVTSATLRISIEVAGNASRTYGAHRVTASWTETGVTWLRRNSTPTLWTSAGGDFVAAPTDTVPTGTTKDVFLEWNVTPDVAAYISGAAGNFGWLVKDEAENVGNIEFLLRNREDGDGPTPELVVTYTLTDTPACDDGSGCTTNTCDFAGCHYTPVAAGTECNDGNGRTQSDS